MPHLFQKGLPRPAKAGRRVGTPNKTTQKVGQFCREVLETPEFRQKWREYFLKTPLHRMEPKLLTLCFSYGYGKAREHIELTGAEGGPLEPQVIFYLPTKERDANPS
jgi:hypothetical protein